MPQQILTSNQLEKASENYSDGHDVEKNHTFMHFKRGESMKDQEPNHYQIACGDLLLTKPQPPA